MQRYLILFTFLIASLLCTASASADEDRTFHPSRVRLLVHGKHQVADRLQLRGHFIPAGNLLGELAPLAYTGLGYTASDSFDFEVDAGYSYKPDEPIAELRMAPSFGRFWAWGLIDWQIPSNDAYWFVQAQYKVSDILHIGGETENWGNYKDGDWSYGVGPNILLRLGDQTGFDFAIHFRDIDGSVKPAAATRFHIFLK